MKLLNDRVSHDLPLIEAEWAAWRQWMGLVPRPLEEEEEEEEEEGSTSSWGVIRRCGQGFRSRSSVSGA